VQGDGPPERHEHTNPATLRHSLSVVHEVDVPTPQSPDEVSQ
jgi:hypothetical protein